MLGFHRYESAFNAKYQLLDIAAVILMSYLWIQSVQKPIFLASKRSEPSSRATLMGEQPNPWELLHPQDVTSRHRCRDFSAITRRIGLYLHPVKIPTGVGVL